MPAPDFTFTVEVVPEPMARVVHVYLRDGCGRWLTIGGTSPEPTITIHPTALPFITVADEFAPDLFAALKAAVANF